MQSPELRESFIPTVAQEFETFDEAFQFYNTYAKHTGFGIKKAQRDKRRRYLRCVCEGTHNTGFDESDRQRDKVSKKTGCKTFMRLKERDDGSCVVMDIILEHNHPLLLTPSMQVFLHSHKRVDATLQDLIKDLQFSNVKHASIMGFLSRMNGGRNKLPCHDKDIKNM